MSAKTDARSRARAAKARLDAERIERDKRIEDATTKFYAADDAVAQLKESLSTAESERDQYVIELLDLGESVDRVSVLTELPATEIRKVKRGNR